MRGKGERTRGKPSASGPLKRTGSTLFGSITLIPLIRYQENEMELSQDRARRDAPADGGTGFMQGNTPGSVELSD